MAILEPCRCSAATSHEVIRLKHRVILFGDMVGIPQLVHHTPREIIVGVVAAEIRPSQHDFLRTFSKRRDLPFFIQPRVDSDNYSDFVVSMKHLHPDLILIHSYSMIVRPDVLALCDVVNIHGALLPQYRGANPIQWAILNNEYETGVTMHYVDEGVDTGDIIAQCKVPMFLEDTWVSIYDRIFSSADKMISEEIPKLLSGTNTRTQQDERIAKYWPRRTPEDGLINWDDSVLYIYNLIRALVKPHPGAFYITSSGDKVIIDEYKTVKQVVDLKYKHNCGVI